MSPTPEPDPDPPCRTDTMTAPRPSPYCTLPSGSTRPSRDDRRGAGGASRSDWFSTDSGDSIGRGASSSRKSGLTGGLVSAAHAAPSAAVESSPSTESVTSALPMDRLEDGGNPLPAADAALNASLVSTKSVSLTRSPGRARARADAGTGPIPTPHARIRPEGAQRQLLCDPPRRDDQSRRAVVDPARVAGGDRPVHGEGARRRVQLLD